MKIRLLSDLHLEGYACEYEPQGEDVLVLAGDIHTRCRHEEILDQVPENIQILFVAGNHEYYRGEFHEVNRYLRALESEYANFKWLDNEGVQIDGVDFYGGTMYTDFSLDGEAFQPIAENAAQFGINDFRMIRVHENEQDRFWGIADHKREFDKYVKGLQGWLKLTEGKKRVVISHFAPHPRTVAEQFQGSPLNPYFTVDMERYMGWEGLWLYGHTHSSCDMMIGDTRLVANPRGYGYENAKAFDRNMILEV